MHGKRKKSGVRENRSKIENREIKGSCRRFSLVLSFWAGHLGSFYAGRDCSEALGEYTGRRRVGKESISRWLG